MAHQRKIGCFPYKATKKHKETLRTLKLTAMCPRLTLVIQWIPQQSRKWGKRMGLERGVMITMSIIENEDERWSGVCYDQRYLCTFRDGSSRPEVAINADEGLIAFRGLRQ